MTFGNLSTETLAKLSPQVMTSRGRPTKFTPERLQQIRNLVERGENREQIAEILDVTVGSLQVTCSRLGISLRRPKVDNGVRLLRQLNSISRNKTITMHGPIDHNGSALSQPTEQQSHQNSQGTERTTELPLNLDMIGRLAWEAEFRNMSTAELISELIMGMVKKDLFPEVLGKP
jgi:hypothetical protein